MLRFVYFLLGASLAASAGAQSPMPAGVWLHLNQRIQIEIAPCGEQLCGKLVWFRWPNDAEGRPLVDFKNVNPALRTRPLLGLAILHGLHRTGEGTWEGGKIYNPDDGMEYNSLMTMDAEGRLRARLRPRAAVGQDARLDARPVRSIVRTSSRTQDWRSILSFVLDQSSISASGSG